MNLTSILRPTQLSQVAGQSHLIGENKLLTTLAAKKSPTCLLIYGPPGTGKTTVAKILAKAFSPNPYFLNAVTDSSKRIAEIMKQNIGNPVTIYLDEIQFFNKRQQQELLPQIEFSDLTLIATTTENPYHALNDALISRCMVIEFQPLSRQDIETYLKKQAQIPSSPLHNLPDDAATLVSTICSGDIRRALNYLSLALTTNNNDPSSITKEQILENIPTANMAGFDKDGNSHYAFISALQKSIRGSDPDAATFWLAKLLEGGDIISPSRRLLAICCEDIGLAHPEAITHTLSCVQAAERLGLPEAYKPLTQAVLYLSLLPKSASNERAWIPARDDIRKGHGAKVPPHIASEHAPGYIWPQDKPLHWVEQQYLPDDIMGTQYYLPDDNPTEQQMYQYWQQVKELRTKEK